MLEDAGAMERGALAVRQRLQSTTEVNGQVRVTAGRTLAERFIVDRLGAFHQRHPQINLEVISENLVVSLARHEADIALRFGAPKDSALLARHVGTIALGLYASRAYRDKHAARTPVLIGYDEDSDFIPEASWLNQTFAGRRFAFRITNQSAQAAAARAGFGIALLPRFIAANDLELVPMPLRVRLPERPVWLMLRRDLRNVPRVRAVADYLVELFRRERKLLSGLNKARDRVVRGRLWVGGGHGVEVSGWSVASGLLPKLWLCRDFLPYARFRRSLRQRGPTVGGWPSVDPSQLSRFVNAAAAPRQTRAGQALIVLLCRPF